MMDPTRTEQMGVPPPVSTAVWSVQRLLTMIERVVEGGLGPCVVEGEISGLSVAASGHCYFALRDAEGASATLRCVMFRRAATLAGRRHGEGDRVRVMGRIGLYAARGDLQLVVESIEPAGAGVLYEEFLRRKARLVREGLFDDSRKRPLPIFPRCVAIVTSRQAAALADVLTTLVRRAPMVRALVIPSLVQGADAPSQLVAALAAANAQPDVDVILLVRGGDSIEDLWAFNDEGLVRAMVASPRPVVTGVGHETDVTLADLAADLRAPTPTAAMELVTAAWFDASARLETIGRRRATAWVHGFHQRVQHLDRLSLRVTQPRAGLGLRRVAVGILSSRLSAQARRDLDARRNGCDRVQAELARSVRVQLEQARAHLIHLGAKLGAHDPQAVLARGYAWVEGPHGDPVGSSQAVAQGDEVRLRWHDGERQARITDAGKATT